MSLVFGMLDFNGMFCFTAFPIRLVTVLYESFRYPFNVDSQLGLASMFLIFVQSPNC